MIYITLGDPYSINIEILAKCFDILGDLKSQTAIIGSYWHWQHQLNELDYCLSFPMKVVKTLNAQASLHHNLIFWDIGDKKLEKPADQMTDFERGLLAYKALKTLQGLPLAHSALITLPIDKAAANASGFSFPGQTEYCESLDQNSGIMILAGPKLRVGLVTNHEALRDVSDSINGNLIFDKLQLFNTSLKSIFNKSHPKIAVTGLNPHCSDNGMFGHEEKEVLEPAITKARMVGINVTGPLPADSVFYNAYNGEFDGVLAMFHDQGLGPLKTVHFFDAVNITGGLSFFRGSPDHGPAQNLYLRKSARADSLRELIGYVKEYLK